MRLLVVEDEPAAAAVLAKGLREHTYAVDVAADGATALEQASIDGVDIAIATADRRGRAEVERDVQMPGTTASR